MMPRKFSHINKLAQGLAQNQNEVIPFSIAPNNEVTDKQSKSKLTTIKFKKRRNTSKVFTGSFVNKPKDNDSDMKDQPSL